MALLKIVSNGQHTRVMLDGKEIDGLTDISFTHHSKEKGDNDCSLILGFDLTANSGMESVNSHYFIDSKRGSFEKILNTYEQLYENPETSGKEPPETQAIIDKMKSETGNVSDVE